MAAYNKERFDFLGILREVVIFGLDFKMTEKFLSNNKQVSHNILDR